MLTACVTGADRGLGYELVKGLLKNGYKVFAGVYNKEWKLLDELACSHTDNLFLVELDVSDDASVEAAGRFITDKAASLDILINNSAILGDINRTIFDKLDFCEMLKVFNVNTLGTLRVTNALIPLVMKSKTKLVINISSEAGSIGSCWRESWFAYCMSKAGINMNSAIMHNSLYKLGGQVLVIHPGGMKTWMTGQFQDNLPLLPETSAVDILEIIRNHNRYRSEKPAFIDNEGNRLEW